jgi:DNA-directed RNA polymerase specialized sigma24 family protein
MLKDSDAHLLGGLPSGTPGVTSSGLIERAKMGDRAARDAIVSLYGKTIYKKFVLHRVRRGIPQTRRREHAMEIWQDTLRAMFAGLAGFQHDSTKPSFRAWVNRIAENRAIEFYRQHDKHGAQLDGTDEFADDEPIPGEDDDDRGQAWPGRADDLIRGTTAERTALLRRIVQSLRSGMEAKTHEAGCRAFLGESVDRIASDLCLSIAAVTTAKCRVKKRAREVCLEFREDLDWLLPSQLLEDEGGEP